jgi:hypothetical protein
MENALVRKLRLLPHQRVLALHAPESFLISLQPLPFKLLLHEQPDGLYQLVLVFAMNSLELNDLLPVATASLEKEGILWLCYPKKSSGIKSDLTRDEGWLNVLEAGWDGVAQVAIDATWTAMRFKQGVNRAPEKRQMAPRPPANRTLELPADMDQLLALNPEAKQFFDALSYTNRKEYAEWISGAKKPDTRAARLEKLTDRLQAGLKNPSEKPAPSTHLKPNS